MITLGIIIGILAIIWASFEVAQYKVWAAQEIKKNLDEVRKHEKEFADSIVEYIENTWEDSFEDELDFDTELSLPYMCSKVSEACKRDGEETTYDFFIKYLGKQGIGSTYGESIKVKISTRQGAILIEKIYDNNGEINECR